MGVAGSGGLVGRDPPEEMLGVGLRRAGFETRSGDLLPRFPQQTRASSRVLCLSNPGAWKALSTDVETCVDRSGKPS
jgi:hypothetical protein